MQHNQRQRRTVCSMPWTKRNAWSAGSYASARADICVFGGSASPDCSYHSIIRDQPILILTRVARMLCHGEACRLKRQVQRGGNFYDVSKAVVAVDSVRRFCAQNPGDFGHRV